MVSNAEDPWSDSRIARAATKAIVVTTRTINVDFLNREIGSFLDLVTNRGQKLR